MKRLALGMCAMLLITSNSGCAHLQTKLCHLHLLPKAHPKRCSNGACFTGDVVPVHVGDVGMDADVYEGFETGYPEMGYPVHGDSYHGGSFEGQVIDGDLYHAGQAVPEEIIPGQVYSGFSGHPLTGFEGYEYPLPEPGEKVTTPDRSTSNSAEPKD